MYNELPKRITELRKEHFKSAQAFADALHVSLKTVQGWEKKDNPKLPTLENLIAICDLFDFDLDYFTGRLEQPTHDIQYIHEKTGLSVEAIRKLISDKEAVKDSPLSDIIVHDNATRLLRVLLLASDADEIAWLNLDELPRDLFSNYADKPLDFSVGIGSDVAEYLVSQEISNILKDVRNKHEKERGTGIRKDLTRLMNVYEEKQARQQLLEAIDRTYAFLHNLKEEENKLADSTKKNIVTFLDKVYSLRKKVLSASYAEWKSGELNKAFESFRKEIEEYGQH